MMNRATDLRRLTSTITLDYRSLTDRGSVGTAGRGRLATLLRARLP
jgi:hypothetical protein